jgi:hypothetical protein
MALRWFVDLNLDEQPRHALSFRQNRRRNRSGADAADPIGVDFLMPMTSVALILALSVMEWTPPAT